MKETANILVVDDDPANRELIRHIFAQHQADYHILQAADGETAYQVANKHHPDIIIMDWEMPKLDGIAATKRLKADKKLKDIPVIIVSGKMLGTQYLKEAINSGAFDFLPKPIKEAELLARVYSALKLAQAQTILKEQKDELERSNNQIKALFNSTIEAYFLLDNDAKVLRYNKIAEMYVEDLLGIRVQRGKSMENYLTFCDPAEFRMHFQTAQDGRRFSYDSKKRHKYVGDVWYHVNYLPAYNQDKERFGISLSILDITRRKRVEETVKRQNQNLELNNRQLSELNDIKNKILSIISHDLRSPLSSLQGLLNVIKDEGISQKDFQNIAQVLDERVGRTLEFLDNLLYWSKSQMSGLNHQPSKFDLFQLSREIAKLLEPQAEGKQIEIKLQNDTSNSSAYADVEMIRLVLRNLISNAIKFSHKEKVIQVLLEQEEQQGQTYLSLSVTDEGIGISADRLDSIFNINQSLSTFGTAQEKGSGLGLGICKEFIEINEGKISVESEENKGSCFRFIIPQA